MEKIISINGKDVKFKATAGTMLRYRNNFKRDFIKDLIQLQSKFSSKVESGTEFEMIDLELFERIAWCMVKTADNSIPGIEEWLDDFETFDIMKILPELTTLLIDNMNQLNPQKKTIIQGARET